MSRQSVVAKIDEATCIGCTKCIQVCPVDAIIGANKQMHIVLPEFCIGCDLCLAPCPVDAISLIDASPMPREGALLAKKRFQARKLRLKRIEQLKAKIDEHTRSNMNDIIQASINKAKLKKAQWDNVAWEYNE